MTRYHFDPPEKLIPPEKLVSRDRMLGRDMSCLTVPPEKRVSRDWMLHRDVFSVTVPPENLYFCDKNRGDVDETVNDLIYFQILYDWVETLDNHIPGSEISYRFLVVPQSVPVKNSASDWGVGNL